MPRRNHRPGIKQSPRDRNAIKIHRLTTSRPQRSLKCSATPGKVRYKTEKLAVEGSRRHQLLSGTPQRVYFCPDCDGWHLSSSPKIEGT